MLTKYSTHTMCGMDLQKCADFKNHKNYLKTYIVDANQQHNSKNEHQNTCSEFNVD